MKRTTAKLASLAFLIAGAVTFGTGCEAKGPAERAGEKVDQGIQNAKDAIDPAGPAEKAGRGIDKALNK